LVAVERVVHAVPSRYPFKLAQLLIEAEGRPDGDSKLAPEEGIPIRIPFLWIMQSILRKGSKMSAAIAVP
jgi:hypothetical protein